ncbi:hypothetical protein EJB05_29118, partial [Eragrostis curvula]
MDLVPSSAASSSCFCLEGLLRACGRYAAIAARAAGWALGALLTCIFAVGTSFSLSLPSRPLLACSDIGGSLVGIFIGAFVGMSTESGMFAGGGGGGGGGASVGAVLGAIFSTEAVQSSIDIWRSSHSGKYSILFVLDIISNLFSGRIVWDVSPALQRAVQSQVKSSPCT